MLRNYIKLYNQHFLRTSLSKQKDVFKRTCYLPPQGSLKCQISPKFLDAKVLNIQSFRFKSKRSKQKENSESDTDSNDNEDISDDFQDKNAKVLNISVTSLRVDGVLKNALGIARNKVETLFYESKIRVNGEKILKKSVMVREGDEVDLLKGPDLKNPNFMTVARVEVLSIKPIGDSISVKVRRYKSLTVEAY